MDNSLSQMILLLALKGEEGRGFSNLTIFKFSPNLLPSGRLGSLENPLNVDSAPQRGARPTRDGGNREGAFPPLKRQRDVEWSEPKKSHEISWPAFQKLLPSLNSTTL